MNPETKICKKCQEELPLSMFYKCPTTKDKLQGSCKSCVGKARAARTLANPGKDSARQKAYRDANKETLTAYFKMYYTTNIEKITADRKEYNIENKEAVAERNKIYRAANQEKISAQKKEYYEANKETVAARQKVYRNANLEKISEISKAYYLENKEKIRGKAQSSQKKNPEKHAARDAKYRAKLLSATVPWANLMLIYEFYAEARELTRTSGTKHVVDHVIPLQGKFVCGLHVENNLQVLTASENSKKKNKFIPGFRDFSHTTTITDLPLPSTEPTPFDLAYNLFCREIFQQQVAAH
jgi:hypothetical protein